MRNRPQRPVSRLLSIIALLAGLLAVPACGGPASADGDEPILANDADGDGLTDEIENTIGTNPFDPDTDGDRLDDGSEHGGNSSPLLADTDGDQLRDDLEVDLGSAADQPDAIAVLAGTIELPGGAPAAGLTVELECPLLELDHPALTTTTDSTGSFGPSIPWPLAYGSSATLTVRGFVGGTSYFATIPLPPLTTGTVFVPTLTVEEQPLHTGEQFFVPVPHRSGDQGVVISVMNSSDTPASYTWQIISPPAGTPNTSATATLQPHRGSAFTVPAALVTTPLANYYGNRMSFGTGGLTLSATAPVSVAVMTRSNGSSAMIAYSVPPVAAYGDTYVLQSYRSWSDNRYAQAFAGGGSAELSIRVVSATQLLINGTNQELQPGVPAPLNLANQRSLLYGAYDEISGTKLSGAQPFGVVSGTHSFAWQVNGEYGTAMEALLPVSQWGLEYLTFAGVGNLAQSTLDILAGDDGATVSVDGNVVATLAQRQKVRVTVPTGAGSRITSDNPVLVWQLFGWHNVDNAVVQLVPTARWTTDEVAWSFDASGITHELAVLVPSSHANQVTVTPTPTGAPLTYPADDHTVLVYQIGEDDVRVQCPAPMLPLAFGAASGVGAYAYSPIR